MITGLYGGDASPPPELVYGPLSADEYEQDTDLWDGQGSMTAFLIRERQQN